nr:HD domain-containing phosphohydrolase [Bacillus ectoiniformans]
MLEIMFTYAAKISGENDLDRLLVLMAEMGRKWIQADRCTLWLLDEERKVIWTKVADGLERVEIPHPAGLAGHTILSGETVLVKDAYKDTRFNDAIDQQTGYQTKSVLCIPIRNFDGTIIGAYQAINKMTGTGAFSDLDVKHLQFAASYMGKSIQAALLHEELVETQKEIIFRLGEVGESRSQETGQHVKRVAKYSYLLARLYGLSENEASLIELASPMHDIGKVAIPDSILEKPGKLTSEEFDVIKTHTTTGYHIFKGSKRRILKIAAIIAHQHHERWDGKGYPNGLKAEEIHLYARITGLADVFDALASDRIYKKAWPLPKIIQLIQEEKGKQFDPLLADIFLAHIDQFVEIKERYTDVVKEDSI